MLSIMSVMCLSWSRYRDHEPYIRRVGIRFDAFFTVRAGRIPGDLTEGSERNCILLTRLSSLSETSQLNALKLIALEIYVIYYLKSLRYGLD